MTSLEHSAQLRPAARDTTVDKERYYSQSFHQLEMERIWPKVWQFACLATDVASAGDYIEYVIGDYSILIVRGHDGQLRAFHNVCLHRGRLLRQGSGQTQALRCGYHFWTWNLDGTLAEVPQREEFCPFADEDFRLRAVQVDTWGPLVFINIDLTAPPLEEFLGAIPEMAEPYKFEDFYLVSNESTDISANWKMCMDSSNEVWHIRALHPQALPLSDEINTTIGLIGQHSWQSVPSHAASPSLDYRPDVAEMLEALEEVADAQGEDVDSYVELVTRFAEEDPEAQDLRKAAASAALHLADQAGIDLSDLSPEQLRGDQLLFHIFPNMNLNLHPFGAYVLRLRPDGHDPNKSVWDVLTFQRKVPGMDVPPPPAHQHYAEGTKSFGIVRDSDFDNLPREQRGMRSPAYPGLTLSSHETRILHMHDVIDSYLTGGPSGQIGTHDETGGLK